MSKRTILTKKKFLIRCIKLNETNAITVNGLTYPVGYFADINDLSISKLEKELKCLEEQS